MTTKLDDSGQGDLPALPRPTRRAVRRRIRTTTHLGTRPPQQNGNEMTTAIASDFTAILQAGREQDYTVTTTTKGWVEVRNARRQLDPAAKLDFLRLVPDDGTWKLYHLTHNEVIKGEATFSGALVGALFGVVADFFETL